MALAGRTGRISRLFHSNIYLRLAITFTCVFVLGTAGMWAFEHGSGASGHFDSFPESLWSATVHVLSGLEDKEPQTLGGRAFSVLVLLASVGLLGTVAGRFASMFIKDTGVRMPRDIADHIAICNWNDRGEGVVEQLHSPLAEPQTDVVVLTNSEVDEETLRRKPIYERVYFVKGDPTLHATLLAARTHAAKSVIILADDSSPDPDATSTLIALALSSLCEEGHVPHIVAEAMNHRKIQHLKCAHVDEVVCSADYGLGVLAQCAMHGHLSQVYENLLRYTKDTNELYVLESDDVPESLRGETFERAASIVNANRDSRNPAILVGIRRGGQFLLNPRAEDCSSEGSKSCVIDSHDALVVMAYEKPALGELR